MRLRVLMWRVVVLRREVESSCFAVHQCIYYRSRCRLLYGDRRELYNDVRTDEKNTSTTAFI